MTWSSANVSWVLSLHRNGRSAVEISLVTGIPRSTVRDWISAARASPSPALTPSRSCFRCSSANNAGTPEYAYLLGLYLGDGTITILGNGVPWLRISQDARYPDLISRCSDAIKSLLPNRVALIQRPGCVDISASSKHWLHLFPQAGPGPKHLRTITLEAWQQALVGDHPNEFLRGLIHSDGCRSVNVVTNHRGPHNVSYAYPRYFFTNASADIRQIFSDVCDSLGVHWTRTNERNIAVSRKADVAFLDTFIGPKS